MWSRSRFARQDVDRLATELVDELFPETAKVGERVHAAAKDAVARLLLWEEVGRLDVDWDTLSADPTTALRFRQMLVRRRLWAQDTAKMTDAFRGGVRAALGPVLHGLAGQATTDKTGVVFDVPLIELLENPVTVVEGMTFAPYRADALDRGLFERLRSTIERNLLTASGQPPTADIRTAKRLIAPAHQRDKSAAELADLYLTGTPLRSLLEAPVPFSVADATRFEHCHIIGGTGHGKTQLMQWLIHADLLMAQTRKRSVVVIDSQGDLINRLSRLSLFAPDEPNSLAGRLVLIDPADVEHPPALNLFDAHLDRLADYRPVDRERVLNGVVETYENFFGDLLGAELTQKQGVVFKYLARLMLVIPGATIHTLIQLMENPKAYVGYMAKLEGSARYFFETEFFDPSFSQTKRQIQRRLWGVLSTPTFERMFAQTANKLDLFRALQDGKIILINTAKDLLKQEGSQLFGRFFIGLLSQATLERSTLDPEDRTPTMVYVDEAQEYFDENIETILNQARKYRTGITMAHQAIDQLSPRLRDVMAANTSMKCAGGVSAKDARALASEMHSETDFIESMRRRDGRTEFAVWIRNQTPRAIRLTVPLGFLERQPILSEEEYEALIAQNRTRYCGTMEDVEVQLRKLRPQRDFAPFGERSRSRPDRAERRAPEPQSFRGAESEASEAAAETPDTLGQRDPIAPPERRSPGPPPEPGKGGPQHKYLQQLIKGLAGEFGFRAVIEEGVPGGQVDVGLHRGDVSIACEISVTSTPEYEAQHLAKCLRAGFTHVWAIAPDAKRKRAIEARAKERLGEEAAKVSFLTTEEVAVLLEQLAEPAPEETVVRGYRLKSSRKTVSPEEAAARREAIGRILSKR